MKSRVLSILFVAFMVGVITSCKDDKAIDGALIKVTKNIEEEKRKEAERRRKEAEDRKKEIEKRREKVDKEIGDLLKGGSMEMRLNGSLDFKDDLLKVTFLGKRVMTGNPAVRLKPFTDHPELRTIVMKNIFPKNPEASLTANFRYDASSKIYYISASDFDYKVDAQVTLEGGMELVITSRKGS